MPARARQSKQHEDGYLRDTRKPLYCLVFVLPMLIAFHVVTRNYRMGLLVLSYFRGSAVYLPPLALLSVLIGQHLFRKDRWSIRPRVLGGMAVESVLWVAPLIAISHVTTSIFLNAGAPNEPSQLDSIIIGMGGGIYEEFVFHLIGIVLIMAIFVDGLTLPKIPVAIGAVAVTGVLFALSHMNIPPFYGMETFSPEVFTFRIVAGLYLGALFILRGFGIAVGAHVMWNIFVCVM